MSAPTRRVEGLERTQGLIAFGKTKFPYKEGDIDDIYTKTVGEVVGHIITN